MSRMYGIPTKSQYSVGASRIGNLFGSLLLVSVGAVFAFGFLALLAVLRGLVLVQLWAWFLMPLGAPRIGIAHAIGLGIMSAMFTASGANNEKKDWTNIFLLPIAALAVGCVVHLFM